MKKQQCSRSHLLMIACLVATSIECRSTDQGGPDLDARLAPGDGPGVQLDRGLRDQSGHPEVAIDQGRDHVESMDQRGMDVFSPPDQGAAVVVFQEALQGGTPYFLKWTLSVGTLLAGEVYLVRHDPLATITTTSSIHVYNGISEYPNPTITAGEISIWGFMTRAVLAGNGVCLVAASDPTGPCYAEVLGPRLPAGLFSQDNVEAARVELETELGVLTQASYAVPTCPQNPQLKMENQRYRSIGWLLYHGADLLRFIPSKANSVNVPVDVGDSVQLLEPFFRGSRIELFAFHRCQITVV